MPNVASHAFSKRLWTVRVLSIMSMEAADEEDLGFDDAGDFLLEAASSSSSSSSSISKRASNKDLACVKGVYRDNNRGREEGQRYVRRDRQRFLETPLQISNLTASPP